MILKLGAIRKARGMTQAELASKSGVPRISIARYEKGRIDPTTAVAKKIADTLGVTVDDLVGKGA